MSSPNEKLPKSITSWNSNSGSLVFEVASFSNYSAQNNPDSEVPEFSTYAIFLVLIFVVVGFVAMKRRDSD